VLDLWIHRIGQMPFRITIHLR